MHSWKNIDYLKNGNPVQLKAYEAITELNILNDLKGYDPILVGTIPIAIDIEGSDLDIICEVYDFDDFERLIVKLFGDLDSFIVKRKIDKDEKNILVANFFFMDFEFEIYATSANIETFNGYRHMIIEDRIIKSLGEDFRKRVIELKMSGIKTEPAFTQLLGLSGNPYEALFNLNLDEYKCEE
ncbi:MAG: DUF4269 domain-containing protein [Firmicutes bacterium]|jgi:hypothetical protein|nr:DUF4269 domain-containing protein [Bacillota bacterium]